jgi:hypothetical protein
LSVLSDRAEEKARLGEVCGQDIFDIKIDINISINIGINISAGYLWQEPWRCLGLRRSRCLLSPSGPASPQAPGPGPPIGDVAVLCIATAGASLIRHWILQMAPTEAENTTRMRAKTSREPRSSFMVSGSPRSGSRSGAAGSSGYPTRSGGPVLLKNLLNIDTI